MRRPSTRAPTRRRVRVGVCRRCKDEVRNKLLRNPAELVADVTIAAPGGNVRELRPYRQP
jgi:hypothetical protein